MQVTVSSKIKDLVIITPEVFHDFRGEYVETFNLEVYQQFKDYDGSPIQWVEDDISMSRQHVLRGLHGDSKTWKLIQCLMGDFYYMVVDMRKDSPTYLNWESFTLNEKNRKQVLVPAGCANGHLVMSDRCIFSYKQSQYYSGMQNQFTVRWNDPALKLFWPIDNPIVSERDGNAANIVP
ncbi:MAG: dTDP-4-dehydrorhamnose 3,5-epimerase [Bacteroidota bacterium]|jgi:dTDP-4-dehydrorhamnose 3,5-epimerase